MNSEYEQNSPHSERRKSLQELKKMNQPNTEQSSAPITPIVIQCPMPEALTKLTQQKTWVVCFRVIQSKSQPAALNL